MKKVLFWGLSLMASPVFSQTTWWGDRVTQTNLFLDPTEIQMSGSMNGVLSKDIKESQYLPFSIGGDQSIYSKQIESNKAWEIVGEMGSFTQFEWKVVEGIQQRNLINIDYKIAFSYVRKIDQLRTYRLRFFHVSSHLGDDYIFRSGIDSHTTNKVNYEQLEFTYFKQVPKMGGKFFLGAGSVIRPNSPRLPFSYVLGMDAVSKEWNHKWGLTHGLMVKGFQETNFDLNLKAAVGLSYRAESKPQPIRVVVEYYTGHLPYSQYEQEKIEWLGLGLYFKL